MRSEVRCQSVSQLSPLPLFGKNLPESFSGVFRHPGTAVGTFGDEFDQQYQERMDEGLSSFSRVVQELKETQIGRMRPPFPRRRMCAQKNAPPWPPAAGKGCRMSRRIRMPGRWGIERILRGRSTAGARCGAEHEQKRGGYRYWEFKLAGGV